MVRITAPTEMPPMAHPTNCVVPTGGVLSPRAQLISISMPNCTGSMPAFMAIGRKIGGQIRMVALLVWVARGPMQIDMHMYYFAAYAMLAAFCDWRVIVVAAGVTALHHLGLNFLMPLAVFPDSLGKKNPLGNHVFAQFCDPPENKIMGRESTI